MLSPKRPPRQTLPRAFMNALVGIADFSRERNSRIQLTTAAIATALGVWLRVSPTEWTFLIAAMTTVLSLEAVNCAIERVVDLASPGYHELARQSKDLAAAAVLIAAGGAAAIGCVVFVPKLIALVR